MTRGAWALQLAALACGSGSPSTAPVDGIQTGKQGEVITDLGPDQIQPQQLWRDCGGSLECREIQVPLDYAEPGGAQITIALTRARSWVGQAHQGMILMNPGGPGAPGRPFLEAVNAMRVYDLLQGFDLVSFDPRGVGDSTPVSCGSGFTPSDAYTSGGTPELIRRYESDAADCRRQIGALYDHLGSQDVVRDMDSIRAALGQEQLNFYGASYGTRLAALYAQTFPERTRAVALDGPMLPSADLVALCDGQFDALLGAVDEFFADCDAGTLDCPPDVESAVDTLWSDFEGLGAEAQFAGLWKGLLAQPTGREDLADILTALWLYPDLESELTGTAPASPDELILTSVNQAVHCTDQGPDYPSNDTLADIIGGFEQRAPHFAATGLAVATCAGWPAPPDPVPTLTAPDSPPLLLIDGQHDILTPRAFADQMHASLAHSVLIHSPHYGHGALLVDNACVKGVVNDYFFDLKLPEDGMTCE
ncbi:MAG TPA: alpha/beta hydrolase [Polyangiaceae bacterium]|nr:alpha/beta hydrolase [Polyangiaceae bacterium]